MAGARRNAPKSGVSRRANASLQSPRSARTRSGGRPPTRDAVPDVYRELLAEAGVAPSRPAAAEAEQPPLKPLKRPGEKSSVRRRVDDPVSGPSKAAGLS